MTASRPIHLSPGAESEVDHAIAWYNLRRDGLGFEFWAELRGTFVSILMNPEAGPLWRPPEPFRKRVLSRFPFIVFYTIRPEVLVVEAVAHGSRRPGYWLSRTKP